MSQSMREVLSQECTTPNATISPTSDNWQEHQLLPFNVDSPTWAPAVQERSAAEARMLQLFKTLEAEVIPRLLVAHRGGLEAALPHTGTCPPPTLQEVTDFVQLVLARDELPIATCVSDFRDKGMSIEAVFLDLLAPAARHLGDMWVEDTCDFTQVTVALGRLQHLLQALSPAFGAEVQFPAHARRVLLVPAPGDHHTFGLSMVAEFFSHSGWEVTGGTLASPTNAEDMAQREWFDVIGFSVGSDARLDVLKDCIGRVRKVSRNPHVGIMVGGPVFAEMPEQVDLVGADCTAVDGKDAPLQAEQLLSRRVSAH